MVRVPYLLEGILPSNIRVAKAKKEGHIKVKANSREVHGWIPEVSDEGPAEEDGELIREPELLVPLAVLDRLPGERGGRLHHLFGLLRFWPCPHELFHILAVAEVAVGDFHQAARRAGARGVSGTSGGRRGEGASTHWSAGLQWVGHSSPKFLSK